MILDKKKFTAHEVENVCDWGTLKDWNKYKRTYATLFVDIDGVLFKNTGRYSEKKWGETPSIIRNANYLKKLGETGKIKIFFTTSRDHSYKNQTEKDIKKLGIKFDQVIYGLPHCQRILINDYASSNPFRSCESINITRDSDALEDLMQTFLR